MGDKKVTSYRNLLVNLDLEVKPKLIEDERRILKSFESEGRINVIELGLELSWEIINDLKQNDDDAEE